MLNFCPRSHKHAGSGAAPQGRRLIGSVGVLALLVAMGLSSPGAFALTDNELLTSIDAKLTTSNTRLMGINNNTSFLVGTTGDTADSLAINNTYTEMVPYIAFFFAFAVGFRQGMVR